MFRLVFDSRYVAGYQNNNDFLLRLTLESTKYDALRTALVFVVEEYFICEGFGTQYKKIKMFDYSISVTHSYFNGDLTFKERFYRILEDRRSTSATIRDFLQYPSLQSKHA
jgi:hypothetical protein